MPLELQLWRFEEALDLFDISNFGATVNIATGAFQASLSLHITLGVED